MLHTACKKSLAVLHLIIVLESVELYAITLNDDDGDTPLHVACRQGDLEVVKEILSLRNTNSLLKNKSHFTAVQVIDRRSGSGKANKKIKQLVNQHQQAK